MPTLSDVVVDALIPARAGSVGLPGKNMRELRGRPLFLHSLACARRVPSVRRILVSTDDRRLADIAKENGCWVPELRPSELAGGRTPMSDVINYSAALLGDEADSSPDALLLLDPTSPLRNPQDVSDAIDLLAKDSSFDGVISISVPSFNPIWVGVHVESDGHITRHPMGGSGYSRRQDVPPYWRINGSFYVWRFPFARSLTSDWLSEGRHGHVETPEILSHSIDSEEDFRLVEALIASGAVDLPWLESEQ